MNDLVPPTLIHGFTRCPWLALPDGPPHWHATAQAWILTRHADLGQVLKTRSTPVFEVHGGIEKMARKAGRNYSSLVSLLSGVLMFRNPPWHAGARRLARHGLTRAAAQWTDVSVERRVSELLAPLLDRGQVDAVADLCDRLPILMMSRSLGLSAATGSLLHRDGQDILDALLTVLPLRDYDALQARAAVIEEALLDEIAQARRLDEGGLSAMVGLNDAEKLMDDRSLAGCVFFLVLAGIETSVGLLGSCLYFMLSEQGEQERLRAEPERIKPFIEEVLRYAAPLRRSAARRLEAPVDLGGTRLPAGSLVVAAFEEAQHDPAVWENPARFIVGRATPGSLVFGAGEHACIGASQARTQARSVIKVLLSATRSMSLVEPSPDWQTHPTLRRMKTLRIMLNPRDEPSPLNESTYS